MFVVLLRVSKLFEKRVILGLCNLKRGKNLSTQKTHFCMEQIEKEKLLHDPNILKLTILVQP